MKQLTFILYFNYKINYCIFFINISILTFFQACAFMCADPLVIKNYFCENKYIDCLFKLYQVELVNVLVLLPTFVQLTFF